ncbi:MAG: hypothetical protein K2N48_06495 [Muribaculaceae bacterium]|nr:hypothetical protein [Muribaculaceae bacterium]
MKKSLLLLSCAAIASVASAQVAVMATEESLAEAGIVKDKTPLEGDLVYATGSVGSIATAYADKWGTTQASGDYKTVKVNDLEVTLGTGVVGDTNPVFVSFEEGAPTAGAVFKIHSNVNGYMTVFTKMNPNKQFVVFEDTDGALSYTLGYSNGTQTIHYALPFYTDEEENASEGIFPGYVNTTTDEASKYFVVATKQSKNEEGLLLWKNKVTGDIVAAEKNPTVKDDENQQYQGVMEDIPGQSKPQFPWIVEGLESAPKDNTGFLTFNVYEDTDYYFSALGSKIPVAGFVYTETNPTVTYVEVLNEDGSVKLPEIVFPAMGYGADPNAVEAVAVENANAPIYNALGVRVNADAKGLLIQNGKKFIRK